MKIILKQILTVALLLVTVVVYAQTPTWQWGHSGGGLSSSSSNGEDEVIDMATDQNGNVYVLSNNTQGAGVKIDGQQSGVGFFDRISVTKWDCQGDLKWVKTFGGGQGSAARAIGTDTLGGVYVIGYMLNTDNNPWPAGYAYFDTDTTLPVTNKSMYLIKYDTSGAFQWLDMPESDTVPIGNGGHTQFSDISVSPNGNIYIFCFLGSGVYNNGNYIVTEQSNHILEYNRFGTFLGGTEIDVHTSPASALGGELTNVRNARFSRDHHSGRYYLSGYYEPTFGTLSFGSTTLPDTPKFYLAAFDNTGNSLWTKINTGDGNNGILSRPAINEQGDIYICGGSIPPLSFNGYTFVNSFGQSPVPFVVALDSNGNNIWATNGNTASSTRATGITCINNTVAVDGSYAVILQWDSLQVTGPSAMTPPKYNYLARFNATSGNIIGLDSIPSNDFNTLASSITADKNNNFYVGGQFGDQLYVAGDTLQNQGGMYDWFVAKFGSSNCNCDIPQPGFNYTGTGGVYSFNYTGSTPYTGISWDFGDGTPVAATANPTHTYAASGTYHVCVTVTNACGSNTTCQTINYESTGINNLPGFDNLSIYPNPATQEIVIDNATAGTVLDIYNVIGRKVLQTTLKGTRDQIDIRGLSSGVYLMRFTDKDGRQGGSKFVKE